MVCEICMSEVESLSYGVCPECIKEVVKEIKKKKKELLEENAFVSLLLETMGMTQKELCGKGRRKDLVTARNLHVIFLRNYMGHTPRTIMVKYGLNRTTYYNSIKKVESLTISKWDRIKYNKLFTTYPKLLEDHTKSYNKKNFFNENSRTVDRK